MNYIHTHTQHVHLRHTDEGRVATVEEGAVEHLQDEGEVLKRQVRRGGTNGEQQTLQRRQEERKHGCPQVGLLFTLSYTHTKDKRQNDGCCFHRYG